MGLNLVKRGEHFSWDPEEERKRQEKWQQEQERMLQVQQLCYPELLLRPDAWWSSEGKQAATSNSSIC